MRALLLSLLCIFLLVGHVSASETQGSRGGLSGGQPLEPAAVDSVGQAVDGDEVAESVLLPTLHWGAKWFLTGICVSLLFVLFLYLVPGGEPHKTGSESVSTGDGRGAGFVESRAGAVGRQAGERFVEEPAPHAFSSPSYAERGGGQMQGGQMQGGQMQGGPLAVGPNGYPHAQPSVYMPYLPAIPIAFAGASSHWPHGQPPPGGVAGGYGMGSAAQPGHGYATAARANEADVEREWSARQFESRGDEEGVAASLSLQPGASGGNVRQTPEVKLAANPFGVKLGDAEFSLQTEGTAETKEEESIVDEIVRENRELKLFA